jgi:muramoyltetrapeptide carboxypeptidase
MMNRKNFLSSLFPLAAGFSGMQSGIPAFDPELTYLAPPYLKPGDTIGITSPAGFILIEDIQSSINKLQEWGFNVAIGNSIGKKDFTFGGTDAERLADLQQMMDDKNIKAILCARGGYGSIRFIDLLNLTTFNKHPKWIIGFSDVTVLHSHINSNTHIASIHSKMCNSFPVNWNMAEPIQKETIESIRQCLAGEKMLYKTIPNSNNKLGNASGQLVGGNLKTLESLAGSCSDINTKNKILFVEDTGEYLYSIDRMFWNLKRSGKLSQLKGLIIGGFKIKKDDAGEEFGKTLEEIVLEKVKEYSYPVCFDFPVGHQVNNYALKCGVVHHLMVDVTAATLSEK